MDLPNFKNIFQKSTLNIYLSDKIEVGYNQSGTNLALSGSLTTSNKILFIDDIVLDVISKDDRSYRQFGWEQFRPHKFTVGNFQGMDLKMASQFFITPTSPFQYNIFFSDQETYQKISPLSKTIKEAWQFALVKNSQPAKPVIPRLLFESFIKEKLVTELWEEIKKASIWEKGEYTLTMVVRIKNPNQNFELQKSFQLTDANIEYLNKNSNQILAELCNQSKIQNISFAADII